MAAPKTSIVPKPRPRTKTKEKTLRGRPVWIDNTGEVTGEKGSKYSEVTTTIPWGTEWITAPSIDENGKRLSDDEVKQRLLKTRGKDFITGEELPTFSNPEKASEYAMWRSDTMFDQEAIEQGFPEEFPMGPEPERKDFIDRSIDKGKDFLEYLTTPSKHGVFNEGGDVGLPTNRLIYDVDDITGRGPEGKIKRDAAKKRVLEKYNLEGARSGWKVSPSKLVSILGNLPTNVRLLTEFMLGKDKPISINDFTKDELASIIALSEEQQENYKNVQNRKLKNQPENVTTVDGYDTTQPYRFSKWIENSPYFRTLAFTLTDPNYQTRTTLGRYDTEETPSSIIIKDAYDMNIKQRDLPNPFGDRKELSKVLEEVRSNPEVAGEFLANIIRPNQNDSRKFDLVIPKRKPDQPSPKDTAYQAPMQLKEKPKDNPRVKEKVPEGFDILKFDEGGDVAAQTDNLFGYTDKAVTKEVDKYKENVNTELSFKDAATFVAEATPIIGDALAAKEVYDELQKNNPNYLLVGALGGAALVGLIPGLGDAAARAIRTGAKKTLDTTKRAISKSDDYKPEINKVTKFDEQVQDYISTLENKKELNNFKDEYEILDAWQAGVLNAPEYFDAEYKLKKQKINFLSQKESGKKTHEYNNALQYVAVYDAIGVDELLELAKNYPNWNTDPDLFNSYEKMIAKLADEYGVDPKSFNSVILDARPIANPVGELTEVNLPKAAETGDIYPKKATEYFRDPLSMPPLSTATDRAARELGFDDTVYHLAVSGDEFTNFKNVDEMIPELSKGPTDAFQGTPHDLLGVHVGTARAAADRFRIKSNDLITSKKPQFTMELKARLNKPVRPEDLANKVGLDLKNLELDDAEINFTESDVQNIIKQKAKNMNPSESYISTTMENNAAIALRKELAEEGYTHIPYVNYLEDKESISYIMLIDRPKNSPAVLRDTRAKFNPKEATNPDLRMAQGGVAMNEQMEMAFMQQGGLKDDGMKRDPVSGNKVPNGSMAKEVRDDIPAQLSEGEYVVPADVVRYLGVKHFEDLRDKAKQGLQKMEATGRIGGEPVPVGGPKAAPMMQQPQQMQPPMPQAPTPYSPPPAPMPPQPRQMAMGGDLTPEEMQEINNIMMNQGGMVAGAANGADFSFYKPPAGVSVEEAITTPGRPGGGRYTGEFSFEQPPAPITTAPAPAPAPTGETPQTCAARGMVYNPDTKMCEMPAPTPRVGGDGSSKDEDKTTADPNAWMDSYNYTDVQSILDSSTKALEGPESGTFGALVNRVFGGGIFGVLGQAGTAAQIAANVKILESIGATEEAATLKGKLDGFIKSNDLGWIPGFMIDGDQLAAGATSKLNIENLTEHYGAQKRMDKATTAAFGAARAKELSEKYGGTAGKGFKYTSPDTGKTTTYETSGYLEAMTDTEREKLTEELNKAAEEKQRAAAAAQPSSGAGRDDDYSAADMMRDRLDKKSEGGKFSGSVTGGAVYAGGNRAEGGLMLKKKKPKKKK